LTGNRYGKLVALEWARGSRWRCRCDCGKETVVLTANLTRGNTASCGCIRNIKSSKRATKHGLSNTPAYKSWASIKKRCFNPKDPMYAYYGANGITMHPEWVNDPAAFCAYMGQPPEEGMSVDRIDNAKGYVPGNVRWATNLMQARNRTTCVRVEFQGRTYQSVSEFVEWLAGEIKVNRETLHREVQRIVNRPREAEN
jgi:hypothetical protein